jgi:hypothetical protein
VRALGVEDIARSTEMTRKTFEQTSIDKQVFQLVTLV